MEYLLAKKKTVEGVDYKSYPDIVDKVIRLIERLKYETGIKKDDKVIWEIMIGKQQIHKRRCYV